MEPMTFPTRQLTEEQKRERIQEWWKEEREKDFVSRRTPQTHYPYLDPEELGDDYRPY